MNQQECVAQMSQEPWVEQKEFALHESPLRSMFAEAAGEHYVALPSLAAAQQVPHAVVIMEGDYGGQIYVVCPISLVHCSEVTLEQLFIDIDEMYWNCPPGRTLCYEQHLLNTVIGGGMKGGVVTAGVWIHPKIQPSEYSKAISQVILGQREQLHLSK